MNYLTINDRPAQTKSPRPATVISVRTTAAVERASHLSSDQVDAVVELANAAGDADGVLPLSEHVMLHLRHGGDVPAVHLLIHVEARLVAYAHVDTTDPVDGASAELVVHPMYRRHGLGRLLVMAATEAAAAHDPAARLRLWAHGDHPSASALALSLGFERHRVLLQLRRSLYAPVPTPELPEGVEIRPFVPGVDDVAWVAVNARAFAEHPDQGRWTRTDLRVRMAEPWFDAAGFLLAWRGETLLGFHWTKVHGSLRADEHGHDHDPIGEVYVLGVDPAAQGLGLGASLTLAGLRYLRGRGLEQVMLYVDESNPRAVELYRRNGFVRWTTDVSYQRPQRP
jgi:mycothiol synthase